MDAINIFLLISGFIFEAGLGQAKLALVLLFIGHQKGLSVIY
jgi:hypothetical protein